MIVWKKINNYDIYEISSLGEVRNINSKKILSKHLRNGYYSICLWSNKQNKKSTVSMHRLVAQHFLPNNNDSLIINHKDGNKINNNVTNLEYVSYKENTKHAIDTGLQKPHYKKISQYDLNDNFIKSFNSIKEAEESTGVSNKHISSVCRGIRKTTGGYKWKYTNENFVSKDLSKYNVKKIKNYPNYYICDNGKVFSIKRKDFLKTTLKNKYGIVKLCNESGSKDFYVHTLMKKYFDIQ
ncbi:MAG: hypothetical protein CMF62_01530 [Magnetococcales bacterium]|nr:hypothetical protein [Magnetococcales bacterium]|tara:strand:+ start:38566 stop:39282 length:717 start_codon:yes stop_codon:yes gene_type:complete